MAPPADQMRDRAEQFRAIAAKQREQRHGRFGAGDGAKLSQIGRSPTQAGRPANKFPTGMPRPQQAMMRPPPRGMQRGNRASFPTLPQASGVGGSGGGSARNAQRGLQVDAVNAGTLKKAADEGFAVADSLKEIHERCRSVARALVRMSHIVSSGNSQAAFLLQDRAQMADLLHDLCTGDIQPEAYLAEAEAEVVSELQAVDDQIPLETISPADPSLSAAFIGQADDTPLSFWDQGIARAHDAFDGVALFGDGRDRNHSHPSSHQMSQGNLPFATDPRQHQAWTTRAHGAQRAHMTTARSAMQSRPGEPLRR